MLLVRYFATVIDSRGWRDGSVLKRTRPSLSPGIHIRWLTTPYNSRDVWAPALVCTDPDPDIHVSIIKKIILKKRKEKKRKATGSKLQS